MTFQAVRGALLALVLMLLAPAAAPAAWTSPEVISGDPEAVSASEPLAAVQDGQGRITAVFQTCVPYEGCALTSATRSAAGTWPATKVVAPGDFGQQPGGWRYGLRLAANEDGDLAATWTAAAHGYDARSVVEGAVRARGESEWTPLEVSSPPIGAENFAYPAVAVDPEGRATFAYSRLFENEHGRDVAGLEARVLTGTDLGAPVVVASGQDGSNVGAQAATDRDGLVTLAWSFGPVNDPCASSARTARQRPDGSFEAPALLAPCAAGDTHGSPAVARGADGRMEFAYTVHNDAQDGAHGIWAVSRAADGTFGERRHLSTVMPGVNPGDLDLDANERGDAVVTFPEMTYVDGDPRFQQVAYTRAASRAWSSRLSLEPMTLRWASPEFGAAVDDAGNVSVVWSHLERGGGSGHLNGVHGPAGGALPDPEPFGAVDAGQVRMPAVLDRLADGAAVAVYGEVAGRASRPPRSPAPVASRPSPGSPSLRRHRRSTRP